MTKFVISRDAKNCDVFAMKEKKSNLLKSFFKVI